MEVQRLLQDKLRSQESGKGVAMREMEFLPGRSRGLQTARIVGNDGSRRRTPTARLAVLKPKDEGIRRQMSQQVV